MSIPEDLYKTYCSSTDNKNFRGDECPKYSELGLVQKTAWELVCSTHCNIPDNYVVVEHSADSGLNFHGVFETKDDAVDCIYKLMCNSTVWKNNQKIVYGSLTHIELAAIWDENDYDDYNTFCVFENKKK